MEETIGVRIKEVRSRLGMTQGEFAARLGMKGASLSNYEVGRVLPPDSTITSICREYGVSEAWLRRGEGEMMGPEDENRELTLFFDTVLASTPVDFRRRMVAALSRLPDDRWDILEEFVKELVAEPVKPPKQERPPAISPMMASRYEVREFIGGQYAAGEGWATDDDSTQTLVLCKSPPPGTDVVVAVSGDSMLPDLHDRDRVFVHLTPDVSPGQIGIFFADGGLVVKEMGRRRLISKNPDYPDIDLRYVEYVAQGVVLGVMTDDYLAD